MRFYDSHDAGVESLKRLMPLTPDPGRTEWVRERCRTQLGRRRRGRARIAVIAGFTSRVLAPVLAGGFCVLYVAALVATTFRLEGVFP
jgi:hypothetical protein